MGSPREQSQDDPVTSRKVSASPGRNSDMRFSLTAPSPESAHTRTRTQTALVTQAHGAERGPHPRPARRLFGLRRRE